MLKQMAQKNDTIVQYIVLRKDLLQVQKWPIGAIIAQGCHACSAAIFKNYHDEHVQSYLNNLERMHKIVLSVNSEKSLYDLKENLSRANIQHHFWIEQPEGLPTCIATKPFPKSVIQDFFKDLKLLQ